VTAICAAGGPSQPKATSPAVSWLASVALGALLRKYGLDKAAAFAGFLDPLQLVTNVFCAVDPPSLPSIVAQDVIDLIGFDPLAKLAAAQKFEQLLSHYAWFELCECVSGAQPAPTAPPAWPTTAPTAINVGVPNEPCSTCGGSGLTFTAGTNRNVDVCGNHPSSPAGLTNILPLPAGATSVRVRGTRHDAGATHAFISFNVQFWTQANGGSQITVSGNTINTTGNQTAEWVFAVPSNALGYTATLQGGINSQTDTADMTVDIFCDGAAPNGTEQACCSPDENLAAAVQQILQLVTLVQRQSVPFSYTAGAVHSGLSGNGEIAVQGLIGVLVEVTAEPSSVGASAGDPLTLWGVGTLRWGNADGFADRRFVSAETYVDFPAAAGQYTRLAYSLAPNVTVTITELEREP